MTQNKSDTKQGILIVPSADDFIRIMEDLQKQYNAKYNGEKRNG